MSLSDKVLGAMAWVAPGAAMRRAHALAALNFARGYDAAKIGRRGASFNVGTGSANNAIGPALSRLRERSSDMVRNTWLGARVIDILAAHAVGTGISVKWETDAAQRLWDEWCGQASIEGEHDFAGLQVIAARSMFERGDTVTRMLPRKLNDRRPVPFALHVLEGDMIDESQDGSRDDRRARLGVVLGEFDERLGYYLHEHHPGEMIFGGVGLSNFVSRDDVCHLYRALRAGQVRGVPVLGPSLMTGRDYADLLDAMVVKSRMEACYGLAITSNNPATNLAAVQAREDEKGRKIEQMAPGMIYRGQPGEEITTISPSGTGQFESVAYAALIGIASGGMLTYDQLTGDLRQANYSSLRAGKIEFRRLIEQLQWTSIVPLFLNRITSRWRELATLSGRLRARKAGYAHEYVMPAIEPIDPLKDMQADILAVRSGRMSPQEFIGAWGRDWRKVITEIREFWKEADTGEKLILDIDPRRVDQSGAWQSAPPTDADNGAKPKKD